MGADALATQRVRASAPMLLTQLSFEVLSESPFEFRGRYGVYFLEKGIINDHD